MPAEVISVVVFAAVLLLLLLGRIERRLARQEEQIAALLAHLGVSQSASPAPSEAVLRLMAEPNGKIRAIKKYRAETGLGLAAAVAAVEKAMAVEVVQGGG